MGVYIKIPNVTFTKYIGIAEIEDEPITPDVPDVPDEPTVPDTYPVTDTLKALYYLGGTQDESLVDQSGNGNNATVIGTGITYSDGYATFTGAGNSNRLKTELLPSVTDGITVVALFRVPTGKRAIVSNYKSGNAGFAFTNDRVEFVSGAAFSRGTFTAINSTDNFAICAWNINQNGYSAVRDVNGTLTELKSGNATVDDWTQPLCIGGYYTNISLNDTADIALVSIHEGDVTDEQLQQIFAHVRWYGESKGLTIE
jgi:hypothetical protein